MQVRYPLSLIFFRADKFSSYEGGWLCLLCIQAFFFSLLLAFIHKFNRIYIMRFNPLWLLKKIYNYFDQIKLSFIVSNSLEDRTARSLRQERVTGTIRNAANEVLRANHYNTTTNGMSMLKCSLSHFCKRLWLIFCLSNPFTGTLLYELILS